MIGMGMIGIGMDATSYTVLQDYPWMPPTAFAAPTRNTCNPKFPLSCAAAEMETTSIGLRPPPLLMQAHIPTHTYPHPKCDSMGTFTLLLPGLSSGVTGLRERGFLVM